MLIVPVNHSLLYVFCVRKSSLLPMSTFLYPLRKGVESNGYSTVSNIYTHTHIHMYMYAHVCVCIKSDRSN